MFANSIQQAFVIPVTVCLAFLASGVAAPRDHPDAMDLRQLGRDAFQEGRYADATQEFRIALAEFEKNGDSVEIAETLGDLAVVLVAQEAYAQAEPLLDRALALMLQGGAAHASGISRLLVNLGALYASTGRLSAAEGTFNRVVRLLERYAKDDPHLILVLGNLGSVHIKMANYKQARRELEWALSLAELRLERSHRDFLPALINLAALYERRKNWLRAESYLVRAAHIAALALQPNHPDRAVILEHLGVVHFRQKKLAEAEKELRSALDIQSHALGLESVRTISVSLNLARVLTARGQYDEASGLYTRALPMQERRLGSKTPEFATALENFARLLHAMKNPKAAKEMEARARRIRRELAYTRSVSDPQAW